MTTDSHLTLTEAVMGSPCYMSPEQAAGKTRSVSTATDIYSLGVMLYELLTGQLPFRAETPLATLKLVTDAEPPKPRGLNPALDRDLETICQKCLEKDPAHRYPSVDALAEDLERWRANKPITGRRTSLPERVWKWVKREPLKAALAVLIVLAVLGPWLVARAYLREFPHIAVIALFPDPPPHVDGYGFSTFQNFLDPDFYSSAKHSPALSPEISVN